MTASRPKLVIVSICAVAMMAPSFGWAQPASVPPVQPVEGVLKASPEQVDAGTAEYILGPEDVIEVELVGQADKMRARVYTDGTIQLNLIGKLTAQGKTPRGLGEEIAALLKAGGFYANPVVNIEVTSFGSRFVTVLGQVASPGLVPINRPYRLSEILARVGSAQAGAADYLIVRSEAGTEKRYMIEELATGDATKDPYVTPGDKIFAPPAEVFYISGQVHAPGPFAIKSGLTVRQAIARAGGLTPSGSDKKVEVNRDGKKVKLTGDALVKPNDVLVVGERLF